MGKAQVGNKPANILEYVPTDKEKAKQKEYQAIGQASLFFDEKTRLLLMITAEILSRKVKIKKTYFFSDYQEMYGLLVAKRINVESLTSNDATSGFMGKKTVRRSSKTIQEITVKSFKVNPVFKKGTFEVKRKNKAKKVRKKQ